MYVHDTMMITVNFSKDKIVDASRYLRTEEKIPAVSDKQKI